MKPYSPNTGKGRTVAVDDVHHRSADQPRAAAKTSAKKLRHAARQDAKKLVAVDQF